MDKFWEWMKEMEYCESRDIIISGVSEVGDNFEIYFEKQMLIGYMIEHLLTKQISFRRIGHWIGDRIHDYLLQVDCKYNGDNGAEVIYDLLKEKIEGMR